MSENFKDDRSLVLPQNESDMVSLIKKIQKHLVFLERKIDTLLEQSSGKSFKGRPFSKPYKSFNSSHRDGTGRHGYSAGANGFHRKRGFDRPQGGENRHLDRGKKRFY